MQAYTISLLTRIAVLVVVFANACGIASANPAKKPVKKTSWMHISGCARDLAVSAGGVVFAVARDGTVWQRDKTFSHTWGRLPGEFYRIAATPGGKPWAIGNDGSIYRFNGSWWTLMPGKAADIASGGDGVIAIIDTGGVPRYWDGKKGTWLEFNKTGVVPPNLQNIAIDEKGAPWVVDSEAAVWRLHEKKWQYLSGEANDIASGPAGEIYISSLEGELHVWNRAAARWDKTTSIESAMIPALGLNGQLWFVEPDGSMQAMQVEEKEKKKAVRKIVADKSLLEKRRSRSGSRATITNTDPIQFVKVPGLALDVAIGADGSIFAVSTDGTLLRWSNSNKLFVNFPGALTRISVDKDGKPWGVDSNGGIYYYTGTQWETVKGTAADITVGYDGTVMIADANENIYRYNRQFDRFDKLVNVKGVRVAVDPRGNVWTIRKDNRIYRCQDISCLPTPLTARDIDIGPDGSVYMVSLDQKLYRWDENNESWIRIDTIIPVIAVAVGPSGRPWVVNKSDEVYASKFFDRDETQDARVAASAAIKSSSAPVSVFTFTKAMQFKRLLAGIAAYVATGADGKTYVTTTTGGGQVYDSSLKTFVNLTLPFNVSAVNADKSGRRWIINQATAQIYQETFVGSNVYVLRSGATAGTSFPSNHVFDIGADGSVFVVDGTAWLYKYDPVTLQFKVFDNTSLQFQNVAVDGKGYPWIMTTNSRMYRYDGKKFVPLPGNGFPPEEITDLDVGINGSVYTIGRFFFHPTYGIVGYTFKWNPVNRSFDRTSQVGTQVAVDSKGIPWVILNGDLWVGQ